MQKDAGRCSYVRTAVVTQQGKKLAELFAAYEQQVSKAAQELFGQFFEGCMFISRQRKEKKHEADSYRGCSRTGSLSRHYADYPGCKKDAVFRKGHVITPEDIPVLLSVGKEHIYIWENDDSMLHENDAALVLYDLCKNEHMLSSEIKEGKIELIAQCDGLFQADRKKLRQINALGEMMIACRHGGFPVHAGDKLAGMRVIPLVIEKEKMQRAKEIGGTEPIFALKPFLTETAGIVTTGSEVYYGRIRDTFTPVIIEKLSEYGITVIGQELSDDDPKKQRRQSKSCFIWAPRRLSAQEA